MISELQTTLYDQVVGISERYLGSGADKFISRHIELHLKKDPVKLNVNDLDVLVAWIRPSMALLTDDNDLINEFSDNLLGLKSNRI